MCKTKNEDELYRLNAKYVMSLTTSNISFPQSPAEQLTKNENKIECLDVLYHFHIRML